MSAAKHTPGAWKVGRAEAVRGDWSCHDDDAKTSTAQPITDGAGNVLAFVADSTQSYKERASFDADARLIASAPELLEALQVLRAQCESMASADWRQWEELASPEEFVRWAKSRASHMEVQARAAIAKATGAA